MSNAKWISIYREQFRSIRRLSDEQAGVLLKALIDFSDTGKFPSGLELVVDILLDEMTSKIKRDSAKYDEKRKRMQENASKRWDAKASEEMQLHAKASEEMQLHAKASEEMQLHSAATNENANACNYIYNYNYNHTTSTSTPVTTAASTSTTTTPLLSDDEVLADVKAMAEVMDAVEQAGFGRSVAVASTVNGMVAEYGHNEVKAGVQQCVEQGVVKLAYLRKVLENRRNGVEKPKPLKRDENDNGYRNPFLEMIE